MVEEPTLEQTIEILMGIRERYEQHHKVTITDDAVKAAADLSIRYITDRHLPDKAIDLIDEAASRVRLRHASAPPPLREAQRELDRLTKEKDGAINSQDYESAAKLREDEATLREKVDTLRAEWQTTIAGDAPTVDEEEIAQVVAMWTGIPVTRIAEEESERLLHMEDALHHRVIGQHEAIEIVSQRRATRPSRPQGPEAPDRLVRLPRPDRRRQDRARQGARRVHVRQRGHAHQDRHERVHGAPQRRRGSSAPLRATSASTRAAS